MQIKSVAIKTTPEEHLLLHVASLTVLMVGDLGRIMNGEELNQSPERDKQLMCNVFAFLAEAFECFKKADDKASVGAVGAWTQELVKHGLEGYEAAVSGSCIALPEGGFDDSDD